MNKLFQNIGPGALVAAAFIGPGTVTVCTLAGVQFSFTLIWAIVLSTFATIFLQEMAARLGLVSGKGLAESIHVQINNPTFRRISILIIMSAIVIGNAAYEAGNISGGVLGLGTLFGEQVFDLGFVHLNVLSLLIGLIAFLLLFFAKYKHLEKALVGLVILMSLSFLVTAVLTMPAWGEVFKGALLPSFPDKSLFLIIGLVGTTIVPYNLFLHASLVQEKWNGAQDLRLARRDLYLSVGIGGLVSIAIVICGAAIETDGIKHAGDLALGLEPLFGSFAKYFLSIGLFAAGISSAITAPLAAAFAAKGCFRWNGEMTDWNFRLVWMIILLLGILFSSLSYAPITIIKFAQVANGILLPLIATYLVIMMNNKKLLGSYVNRLPSNIVSVLILLATVVLGLRGLDKVFHFWS